MAPSPPGERAGVRGRNRQLRLSSWDETWDERRNRGWAFQDADDLAQNLTFSEEPFDLADTASFLQQGVIDSLGVVELVDFAHREFGVEVKPAEVTPANFDSVAALAGYIRRKQAVPGGNYVSS